MGFPSVCPPVLSARAGCLGGANSAACSELGEHASQGAKGLRGSCPSAGAPEGSASWEIEVFRTAGVVGSPIRSFGSACFSELHFSMTLIGRECSRKGRKDPLMRGVGDQDIAQRFRSCRRPCRAKKCFLQAPLRKTSISQGALPSDSQEFFWAALPSGPLAGDRVDHQTPCTLGGSASQRPDQVDQPRGRVGRRLGRLGYSII